MPDPGDVIDVPQLGVRVEFRETSESTGGAYTEVDIVGRPRGFIRGAHVHVGVSEHLTMVEGAMRVKLHGVARVLRPGDTLTIPPGAPHSQRAAGAGPGRVRIRHTPAGRADEFFVRLGELEYNRFGYPTPRSGARMVLDLGRSGHAAHPSLATQRRLARVILAEYAFTDEWDVAAPPEAVFDTLADARTYPEWWKPVYIDVERDGEYSYQHFKGRLPYHLHTRTRTVRSERPHVLEGETDGDLDGTGRWTLTPIAGGTHVRFDWCVRADRPLLRALTPVLRPALRANHDWAIARAMEGLERFARERSKVVA